MEKRKNARFDVSAEMKGKLLNVVSFVANNISVEGINLVSNFQPVIGSTYKIYLMHNRDNIQQDFEIEINRAEVAVFDSKKYDALPPGLLFSIGAKFKNMSEKQNEILASFIRKKAPGPEEGFISKDKLHPGS
jgi:ribosomal protein L24